MVGIGRAASRTVEPCPAVGTFRAGIDIAEFKGIPQLQVRDAAPDVPHFVFGIIDKLMAGIEIARSCHSQIFCPGAAA